MFELPGAKRVRRDELQSPASSPRSSPDPAFEALIRSKAYTEFAFTTTEDYVTSQVEDAVHSDEEETELRLFAAPANAAPQTHRIRLSSPGAGSREPGFLIKKPRSYYFADEPTSEEETAFHAAAIDGRTVVELSKEPWPGCALPWKVRKLSPAGMRKEVLVGYPRTLVTLEEKTHKRTRKGKKTRIALRNKLQASKEKQSENARLAQEREKAVRERKTQKNRDKKVRQKAKQLAKKEGVVEGAVEGPYTVDEGKMINQDRLKLLKSHVPSH
ncbi:hypothetical protein EJ02DRAFT_100530 [Clathrospora elynae]|uniref:Uncharacterized protein n=1 Tax=Clathrospora elynae TaxID=706981 RepID=A0A6A5T5S7_9PLEO|nr:hypothetical protein EJ02DRAFT_100530 [Clathrospora elynae]